MDHEDRRFVNRRASLLAIPGQRMLLIKVELLCLGFCLACTHSQGKGRPGDGGDGSRVDELDLGGEMAADTDRAGPEEVDVAPDSAMDALSSDGLDAAALEIGNTWLDAGQTLDGPCNDNPSDLRQLLATSLGSPSCSRTASTQPQGYINFDSTGRVTSISGYRVPADDEAWVDSLAAYRWPCLAGQTIAYGCSA